MTAKKTAPRKRKPRAKPEANGHIQDGTISIEVQGGPFNGKTIHMDATVVKLLSERLESKHELPREDEMMVATPEFALELDAVLRGAGYDSTPTIAIHVWARACQYFADLQKKTN